MHSWETKIVTDTKLRLRTCLNSLTMWPILIVFNQEMNEKLNQISAYKDAFQIVPWYYRWSWRFQYKLHGRVHRKCIYRSVSGTLLPSCKRSPFGWCKYRHNLRLLNFLKKAFKKKVCFFLTKILLLHHSYLISNLKNFEFLPKKPTKLRRKRQF